MPVTSAQYKFLLAPLRDLGYMIDIDSQGSHITTRHRNTPIMAGLQDEGFPWMTFVMDRYDWQLFLAVAAITTGEQYIAGEYGVAMQNFAPVVREGGVYRFYETRGEQVEIFGVGWHPSRIFRKTSLPDLITYFNYDPYEQISRSCKG